MKRLPSSLFPRTSSLTLLVFALACAPALPPQTLPAVSPGPPPPSELSTIVIPIHASLAPLLPELEKQIPKTLQSRGYQIDAARHIAIKYEVARGPAGINMIGAGLHASATVRYAVEACPYVNGAIRNACVSCGFGEPMRDVAISVQSRLDWGEGWTLRSRTAIQPLEFGRRCTFVGVDVTDVILRPMLEEQLTGAAKMIDAQTPRLASLKPEAQQIWTALQQPYPIAASTWLVLDPAEVSLTPIHGSGLNVASTIELRARTRVVVGAKPATAQKPLPPLRIANSTDRGIRVPFDVELPYAEASRLVTEQFGRRTYNLGGGATLAVDSIRLSAGTNGKTNIEASIQYRGGGLRHYDGLVYLEGVPSFDAAGGKVVVSDIEYSLDPKRHNPFLRVANRMAHDEVREQLRAGARWPVGESIATMKHDIERGITRKLASNVLLRGHVESIQPVSVTVRPEGLTIRAVAVGDAEVEVK
ncbi:MAG TPA: DUF4403 family protein [Thermoanaerobaculia bacterium]|nr:DUF4403 family protein [Thermoanaerobaculia bacterium]